MTNTATEQSPSTKSPSTEEGSAFARRQRSTRRNLVRAVGEAGPNEDEARPRVLELELFDLKHDFTGALKLEIFGQRLNDLFNEGKLGVENGQIEIKDETVNQKQVLVVNMSELDRFNKEGGGHHAGDNALLETTWSLDRIMTAEGFAEGAYQLYRYSGNEIMIEVDGATDEQIEKVTAEIIATRPTSREGMEGAPLSVSRVRMAEVVGLVNNVKALLPSTEFTAEEAARELVEITRRLADFQLEVEKFKTRVARIDEIINNKSEKEAENFFNQYLKKGFSGTPYTEFAKAKELVKNSEDVDRAAFAFARNIFKLEGEFSAQSNEAIRGALQEQRRQEKTTIVKKPDVTKAEMPGLNIAKVPEQTNGQNIINEKRKAWENARGSEQEEEKRLEYQIEIYRRDAGTCLLRRGEYYKDLEKDLGESKTVSVLFIDMGFLKYFDKEGGTEVGNNALKLAAHLLETAVKKTELEGRAEVYRYAGDEFTIRVVDSDDDTLVALQKNIIELQNTAGVVAADTRSTGNYLPASLSFNISACTPEILGMVNQDLTARGYQDKTADINFQAELMTKIADKGVTVKKAADRFTLLLQRMFTDEYAENETYQNQTNALLTYSTKAIFGDAGQRQLARFLNEIQNPKDINALRQKIENFVVDAMTNEDENEKARSGFIDQLIDLHVQIYYLQATVQSLENQAGLNGVTITRLQEKLTAARQEREKLLAARQELNSS